MVATCMPWLLLDLGDLMASSWGRCTPLALSCHHLYACHGGSLHVLTGRHYIQSLTRFTVFFCSLRSNAFTASGPQPWQFVYTQTPTFFSVSRTLGWEAKQSGPYKYVRVWWSSFSTGSLPPSLWKEFSHQFIFRLILSHFRYLEYHLVWFDFYLREIMN